MTITATSRYGDAVNFMNSLKSQFDALTNQTQTQEKYSSAADGAAPWMQISELTQRSTALMNVNDLMSTAIANFQSSLNALDAVSKVLTTNQTAMTSARATQEATRSGTVRINTNSTTGAGFKFQFTSNTVGGQFTGLSDVKSLLVNGQQLNNGDTMTLSVNQGDVTSGGETSTISIKIVGTAEDAILGRSDVIDSLKSAIGLETDTNSLISIANRDLAASTAAKSAMTTAEASYDLG